MPTLIATNTSILEQCDSTVFTQDGPLFFGFMWPSMFIGNEIEYFNCQQNQKPNEEIQAVSADGKTDEVSTGDSIWFKQEQMVTGPARHQTTDDVLAIFAGTN